LNTDVISLQSKTKKRLRLEEGKASQSQGKIENKREQKTSKKGANHTLRQKQRKFCAESSIGPQKKPQVKETSPESMPLYKPK